MNIPELPTTPVLGSDYRYMELAEIIEKAARSSKTIFCCEERCTGPNNETVHVFYTSPARHGTMFDKPMSARDLAYTLCARLQHGTACPPPKIEHRKDWECGWQITSRATTDDVMVVAWATWVPRA